MAIPSWLSLTFTIADFIVQRVDRVGPVELEASSDQPPERAQAVMDADVEPPEMDTSLDEAPPAEVDSPQSPDSSFGFQAASDPSRSGDHGGGNDPTPAPPPDPDEDDDDDDNGNEQLHAHAGGSGDPSSSGGNGGGGSGGNGDNGDGDDQLENRVQCSFRAMRPHDQPTRYETESRDEQSGEGR